MKFTNHIYILLVFLFFCSLNTNAQEILRGLTGNADLQHRHLNKIEKSPFVSLDLLCSTGEGVVVSQSIKNISFNRPNCQMNNGFISVDFFDNTFEGNIRWELVNVITGEVDIEGESSQSFLIEGVSSGIYSLKLYINDSNLFYSETFYISDLSFNFDLSIAEDFELTAERCGVGAIKVNTNIIFDQLYNVSVYNANNENVGSIDIPVNINGSINLESGNYYIIVKPKFASGCEFYIPFEIGLDPTNFVPFVDDFSKPFSEPSPDGIFPQFSNWEDNRQAYINATMPINPVTIGVATLDGLNAKGSPYLVSDTLENGGADTLTSRPFCEFVQFENDTLYIGFFFQPKGHGDIPNPRDSIVLELRDSRGIWNKVWWCDGISFDDEFGDEITIEDADSNFYLVNVPILNDGVENPSDPLKEQVVVNAAEVINTTGQIYVQQGTDLIPVVLSEDGFYFIQSELISIVEDDITLINNFPKYELGEDTLDVITVDLVNSVDYYAVPQVFTSVTPSQVFFPESELVYVTEDGDILEVIETNGQFFGIIEIQQETFYYDNFQFRFRNRATITGFNDHWHIDYVQLAEDPLSIERMDDLAFVQPAKPFLNNYTSMPWNQFAADFEKEYDPNLSFTLRNNSDQPEGSVDLGLSVVEMCSQISVEETPTVRVENYTPFDLTITTDIAGTGDPLQRNDNLDTFEPSTPSVVFRNTYTSTEIGLPINNTLAQDQVFGSWMAYDDGTAEKAYGLYGAGTELAYRYKINEPDSVIGVMIYFTDIVNDISKNRFGFKVWSELNEYNIDTINSVLEFDETDLTREEYNVRTRDDIDSRNNQCFVSYRFSKSVAVDSVFYLGMEQFEEDFLNIGFDVNNYWGEEIDKEFYIWNEMNEDFDTIIYQLPFPLNLGWQNLFINVDGSWQPSQFPGAIMMRPILSSGTGAVFTSIETPQIEENTQNFTIYPNPTTSTLNITYPKEFNDYQLSVFDFSGKEMTEFTSKPTQINVENWISGMYFIRFTDEETGEVFTEKFVRE